MFLFEYIKGLFKRESPGADKDLTVRQGASSLSFYDQPLSTPMAVATVYRCVSLLCGSVAGLQLKYMRLRGGRFVEDTDNHLHYLLSVQPNASTSAYDFKERIIQDVLLTGNCYIYFDRDYSTMDYDRLVVCSRGSVVHDTLLDAYMINDPINGVRGRFSSSEIIHIKGMPGRDARTGVSVLAYARRAAQIAGAGDRETEKRFERGGNMRAFVTDEKGTRIFDAYDPVETSKVATDLNDRVRNDEQFTSVPTGVEVRPYTLSSSDMQFLESRKFTVREICRFFGVHPSFVFDDTSNNYKSAEMSKSAFLSDTLNPLLLKIENEFHRKLVSESLCCRRRFRFDRLGLFASDPESKMRFYQLAISTGVYSLNYVRALEDMPPVDGGDRILVSANLRALEDVTTDVAPLLIATGSTTKKNNNNEDE